MNVDAVLASKGSKAKPRPL